MPRHRMAEDSLMGEHYSEQYTNQRCDACGGTGKTPEIVAAHIKVDDYTAQQAVHITECTSCGGTGWLAYGYRS